MLAMMTALVVSGFLLWGLLCLAPLLGLMDRPDARKVHTIETPLIGGLAWLGALLVGAVVFLSGHHGILLISLAAMGLVGALDDRFRLPSIPRLIAQIAIVATLTALDGTLLRTLGALFGGAPLNLGVLAWGFTVFSLVGVVNAMNMIDGVDGLSGSLATLILAVLAILAWPNQFQLALMLAMAAVAMLPFLALNLRLPWQSRARVFFGDAGSMTMGLLIGYALVALSQGRGAAFEPVTALYVFAVPLIDTVSVMMRRIAQRKSPFQPDQQHVHHLLLRSGFSVSRTVLTIVVLQALFIAAGLSMAWLGLAEFAQAAGFLVLALGYHVGVGRALRQGRFLGRVLSPVLQRA